MVPSGKTSKSVYTVPSAALIPYVLITFAITWGIAGVYILLPDLAVAWFGQITGSHPAFFLATWAPAIAAFLIVSIHGGFAGIKSFLSRLLLWRCSVFWALFLLIGVPLTFVAGSWIRGAALDTSAALDGVGATFAAMVIMLFLGPVEEFGWRGVAQPILQRHMAPLWAGLLIGIIWGTWHLPAFYLSGTVQSDWSFMPFFLGNVSLAVIVTPLFNSARGSLLLPALFHFQLNNPLWPDAQPYDTYIFILVAVVTVWLNRSTMLANTGAVTAVIPAGHHA